MLSLRLLGNCVKREAPDPALRRSRGTVAMSDDRPRGARVTHWQFCAPLYEHWGDAGEVDPPVTFSDAAHVGYAFDWYRTEGRRGDLFEMPESPIAINGQYEEAESNDMLLADSHKMDEATEMCRHLPIAVWCVKPTPFAVGKVAFRLMPGEKHLSLPTHAWVHVQPIVALREYRMSRVSRADLEAAVPLFAAMMALPKDGTVWAALRIVRKALAEIAVDLRIVLLWVALEALFGVTEQGELRFRLSMHLALYLEADRSRRQDIARNAKRLYDERSKVVHGSRSAGLDWDQLSKDCAELENIVRAALRKILSGPDRVTFDRPIERLALLEGLLLGG